MKKTAGFLLVAAVIVFSVPGSALAETGRQTFIATSRVPGGTSGTIVASGPIRGVGEFLLPQGQGPGQFIFPNGTVFVVINANPPVIDVNEQSCLVHITTSGTFSVTGGTGQFAGASGSGTFAGRAIVRLARDAQGECDFGAAPLLFFGIVRNVGDVTLDTQVPA